MTNTQRALWTFLMYALAGPFFAALAVTIAVALASALGVAGFLPGGAQDIGGAALTSFVWGAAPAVVTGLILAGFVLFSGGVSWILAAAVAVIVFAASTVVLPFTLEDARPYLAFLAGGVAIAVREVLRRAGILAA
jgi:hypothetical protein